MGYGVRCATPFSKHEQHFWITYHCAPLHLLDKGVDAKMGKLIEAVRGRQSHTPILKFRICFFGDLYKCQAQENISYLILKDRMKWDVLWKRES